MIRSMRVTLVLYYSHDGTFAAFVFLTMQGFVAMA